MAKTIEIISQEEKIEISFIKNEAGSIFKQICTDNIHSIDKTDFKELYDRALSISIYNHQMLDSSEVSNKILFEYCQKKKQ